MDYSLTALTVISAHNAMHDSPQLWSSKQYNSDQENTTQNDKQESGGFRDSTSSKGSNHPSAILQELLGLADIQIPRYELTDNDIKSINWSRTVKHVNLSDNNLLSFPTVIVAQCPNLQELDVSSNRIYGQLRVGPSRIKISSLKELNVSFNNLTSVSDEFGLMFPYLSTLDVSYNQISKIDAKFLSNSKKLQDLSLDGNQISVPPVHVRLRGVEAMRRYYKAMLPQDTETEKNRSDMMSALRTSARGFGATSKGIVGRQHTTEQSYMPNLIEVVVTKPVPVATATTHDMRQCMINNVRACSFTKGVKRLSSTNGVKRLSNFVEKVKEKTNSGHGQSSSPSTSSSAHNVDIPLARAQFESVVPSFPTPTPTPTPPGTNGADSIATIPYKTSMIESTREVPKFPALPRSISVPISRSSTGYLVKKKNPVEEDPNVNNTVKLVVLGASGAGKTSVVQRLKHGAKGDESNGESGNRIGVDIVECDIDNCDSDVKFSVWDFAGAGGSHHVSE